LNILPFLYFPWSGGFQELFPCLVCELASASPDALLFAWSAVVFAGIPAFTPEMLRYMGLVPSFSPAGATCSEFLDSWVDSPWPLAWRTCIFVFCRNPQEKEIRPDVFCWDFPPFDLSINSSFLAWVGYFSWKIFSEFSRLNHKGRQTWDSCADPFSSLFRSL